MLNLFFENMMRGGFPNDEIAEYNIFLKTLRQVKSLEIVYNYDELDAFLEMGNQYISRKVEKMKKIIDKMENQ